ncbi:MAG: cation transporter [Bacteroidetes bacterium]|nr:MAG: cation transporter [Bacteroidota bacterium]
MTNETVHDNESLLLRNYKLGIVEGWVSGVGNVILFVLKLWVGMLSGSVALIADAWHTLTDTISSIIVILGMKISAKPADNEHPYGHGRAEIIASLIIGILLVLIGIHFIMAAYEKLQTREFTNFGTLAIIVTIISLIVKEGLAQYAFYLARKTKIESIKADGWHHRSDAISSAVILLGIFLGKYAWWVDGVLAILVAFVILYVAFNIFKKAVNNLLGEKPDPDLINEIMKIGGLVHPEGLRMHHFHVHNYGLHNEMTFHIVLPGGMTMTEASEITLRLFNEIKLKKNILATIHIDTESKY